MGRSYSALVCLKDRCRREGAVARQTDVTSRLRNDFRNRLSCRSEEKFGNFLGLICWSVSIEMLRGYYRMETGRRRGRMERRNGTTGVDPSTTNAARSHELYKRLSIALSSGISFSERYPPWCWREVRRGNRSSNPPLFWRRKETGGAKDSDACQSDLSLHDCFHVATSDHPIKDDN